MVKEFKIGNYYQDTTTGHVFLYRWLGNNGNYVGRLVKCFTHGADDGVIVPITDLMHLKMWHYASSFKEAFNKYWRENRERLIRQNKKEIREYERKRNR